MTKNQNTKRALLTSVLSLMLCAAMLIGSTFAWFTDSVTSGRNRIVAGNLDVELEYKNPSTGDGWQNATIESPTFFVDKEGGDILWEPGVVAVTQFKVANMGSLALKYRLETVNAGSNYLVEGKDLSNVIRIAVVEGVHDYADRAEVEAANLEFKDFTEFKATGNLLPADKATETEPAERIFTVVAYWAPGSDDDSYNVNNGQTASDDKDHLYIDIEIHLTATQFTYEEDGFDNDYDQGAFYPSDEDAAEAGQTAKVNGVYYEDFNAAIAAAESESTVTLIKDATITRTARVNADDKLTIDLGGHTLQGPAGGTAIYMQDGGELTLVNGTINSDSYAIYATGTAVIHELNIDMNVADSWGVWLNDNAVLEKVTGGTYKSNVARLSSFPLYISSTAKIGEISGGDFQGSKAAIANYGTIEKISGGTFHGPYYDGTTPTMWEPDYSVMYMGTIGSITGGTFFKGKKNIAQNMTTFNAALAAGGTTLIETDQTATIEYKKGTILQYTGTYYQVVPQVSE